MIPFTVSRILQGAAGVLVAAALLEAGLGRLATPARAPSPAIARDSWTATPVTTRQVEEGVAVARFSPAGARLTGSTPLPQAPVVVLLGDSHVVAREVADEETMGAWLERLARGAGQPLNVRQYGWRGASPPQYVLVAPEVLARWHPERVFVVLGPDDLGLDPLTGPFPRMRIAADGAVSIDAGPAAAEGAGERTSTGETAGLGERTPSPVFNDLHPSTPSPLRPHPRNDLRPSTPSPLRPPDEGALWRRSALLTLLRSRTHRLLVRAPQPVRAAAQRLGLETGDPETDHHADAAVVPAVPDAVVRSLAAAYGDRLAIVYAAEVRVVGSDRPDGSEALLLAACRAHGVPCVSTRDAMLAARARGGITRGFATTTLGVGHLNALGHRVVADALWRLLPPRRALVSRQ